jgi:hypothetical protein
MAFPSLISHSATVAFRSPEMRGTLQSMAQSGYSERDEVDRPLGSRPVSGGGVHGQTAGEPGEGCANRGVLYAT